MDRLTRGLAAVAGASLLGLLVAGTLVNSHQAALSVPDWPLSYGQLILRQWPGNTFYEQLHRLLALVSAVLLAGLLFVARRHPSRRVVGGLLALYLVQVGLGGVIVLRLNPPLVAAIHVVTAQGIVCGVWLLALGVFERDGKRPAAPRGKRMRLVTVVTALLAVQIALGSLARHPPAKVVFPVSLLGHLGVALALVILIPYASVRLARSLPPSGARTGGIALGILFVLQIAVAVPLFIVAPEPLTEGPIPPHFPALHAAHVVLATLLLTTSAYLSAASRLAPRAGVHDAGG
jgi:heme A synthase